MLTNLSSSSRTCIGPEPLRFVVGQDSRGNWLAVETHGLGGGFFCSQKEAIHYAASRGGFKSVRLAATPIDHVFDSRRRSIPSEREH
jgi:hypothetical protein